MSSEWRSVALAGETDIAMGTEGGRERGGKGGEVVADSYRISGWRGGDRCGGGGGAERCLSSLDSQVDCI